MDRGQRADHREQRGERVAERDAGAGRRPVGIAGGVADAAHRLADRAEAGLVRPRPGLAEPGDVHEHEPGVRGRERRVVHAPPGERARLEVLDHDVDVRGEVAHERRGPRSVRRSIATDCLLRAIAGHQRLRPSTVTPHPRIGSPVPGRLDLDHLGAEVTEQLAGERSGDERAELEDAQARERRDGRADRTRHLACHPCPSPPRTAPPPPHRPLRQPVPRRQLAPRPAGRARCAAARSSTPGPRPRARLALRARRRVDRRRAHAPARRLLPPLRDARAARRRDRGAEREQPLAEQRRDADPRAGPARRRRRHRRGPRPLRAGGAHRQQRRRVAVHLLPPPGARARRRAAHPHRRRRRVRPQPLRPARRRRDGVPRRPRRRGPLPAARDRPVGRRRGRSGRRAIPTSTSTTRATASWSHPTSRGTRPSSSTGTAPRSGRGWSASTRGRASSWPRAGRRAPAWSGGTGTTADRRGAIATDVHDRVPHRRRPACGRPVPRSVRTRLRLDLGSPARLDQLRRGRVRAGREPGGVALHVVGARVAGRDRDHRRAG